MTNPPGDVMFNSRAVATALSINSPPSNTNTMAYMLGQGLQWAPGTVSNLNAPAGTDAYSNYGYMVLGEVLQSYAPGGYFNFVHNRIFGPLWVPATEFALARTFPADRHQREPLYIASNDSAPNVFDNTPPIENVPTPDGGFAIEQMMAHGGTIASAQAMLHFANAYHLWYASDQVGRPITTASPMGGGGHSGRLDGTETLLQPRADGIVSTMILRPVTPQSPSGPPITNRPVGLT
jgi:CubicO group peptidase (beta-lactamase class C family)